MSMTLGKSQQTLLKFIITNPKSTVEDIHRGCFNDKLKKYTNNLLYENRRFFVIRDYFDNNSPDEYSIRIEELKKEIDINYYIMTGDFITPKQKQLL